MASVAHISYCIRQFEITYEFLREVGRRGQNGQRASVCDESYSQNIKLPAPLPFFKGKKPIYAALSLTDFKVYCHERW